MAVEPSAKRAETGGQEVAPCPWCDTNAHVVLSRGPHHFTCEKCGAMGPNGALDTDASAAFAWNNQAGIERLRYAMKAAAERLSTEIVERHCGLDAALARREGTMAETRFTVHIDCGAYHKDGGMARCPSCMALVKRDARIAELQALCRQAMDYETARLFSIAPDRPIFEPNGGTPKWLFDMKVFFGAAGGNDAD